MNYHLIKYFVFISLTLFSFQTVKAQWYYSASFEQQYSTNPFHLPDEESDQVSQLGLGIQKDWNYVSAQYYGTYLRFNENNLRNFFWQQFYLSGGDTTSWFLSADNRINREDYELYDFYTLKGGVNHQLRPGNFLFRLGSSATLNKYKNLGDLDNILLKGFLSVNRSFQTRTSFIGAVSFNYKNYLNDNPSQFIETDTTEIAGLFKDGGNGMGPGPGGRGGGMSDQYISYNSGSSSVSQLFFSLRVAQSLADNLGAAVQYYNSFSLDDRDRSVAGLFYGYDTESQIFDDPLGYEGESIGLELTWMLPKMFLIKTSAYFQKKNYLSQGIFLDEENYNEDILREDTRNSVYFSLEKKFNINIFENGFLIFTLTYQWMENNSNSYWYDYRNNIITAGIDLDF